MDIEYTIYGLISREDSNPPPVVHGRHASPPHPLRNNIPPPGLFRWHYLQCVINRFGHGQYRHLQNIAFLELPFRMEGDSDDDGTDSDAQWPSMPLDLGRNVENSVVERAERHRAVENWIALTS